MKPANLPTLVYPEIAHVGTMDPSLQGSGSYEGRCLSVSQVPSSWARIARLGENGFILSGRGRFVDVCGMSERQRREVIDWAVCQGLLELKEIARLHMFDTETEQWSYSDFPEIDAAEDETEFMEEDEFRIEEMSAYIGTVKLAERAGHRQSGAGMGAPTSFDLALVEYASRDPALDGVWWDEHYDPASLSAPRGGIFPDRVADFDVRPADWEELEEFEERFTSQDFAALMENVS